MENNYLQSAIKQFEYYKLLGDKTFAQLSDAQLISIPKGNSAEYNADKFSQPKEKKHFTDEYVKKSGESNSDEKK